jgi:hypothetical protein
MFSIPILNKSGTLNRHTIRAQINFHVNIYHEKRIKIFHKAEAKCPMIWHRNVSKILVEILFILVFNDTSPRISSTIFY